MRIDAGLISGVMLEFVIMLYYANTTLKPKRNYYISAAMSILQVLCKYKIVQKNLFKWTELNSVRFYVIRKISTCQ